MPLPWLRLTTTLTAVPSTVPQLLTKPLTGRRGRCSLGSREMIKPVPPWATAGARQGQSTRSWASRQLMSHSSRMPIQWNRRMPINRLIYRCSTPCFTFAIACTAIFWKSTDWFQKRLFSSPETGCR